MAVTLFLILLFGHIGSKSHFPFNWQLLLNFDSVIVLDFGSNLKSVLASLVFADVNQKDVRDLLRPYMFNSIPKEFMTDFNEEDFYVNPLDSTNIYLGSRSGGFWKTVNNNVPVIE